MTEEALHSSPNVPVVLIFDDYSDEEQQSPTSQFVDQISSQPVYDSYESDSELDTRDLQEQTAKSYPLFTNEEYYEEVRHPGPIEDIEQQTVYDDYESDPWESHERTRGAPEGAVYLWSRAYQ
jgi:hypothetical protein